MKTHSKLNLVFGLLLALAATLQPSRSALGALLDFGVDPANLGKGEWVYVLANATNHLQDPGYPSCYVDSVVDLPTLMAYFKTNLHLQYVVVKAGTGATNFPSDANPQFTADLVNAAHGQGLKIFGYTLTYGTDIPGELAIATNCFNAGADGFVLDAEDQLVDQGLAAGTAAAWNLCGQFKTNWPTRFLGESVYADIYFKWSNAANFPYKELGYWCDTVMPQVYWQSWSQSSSPTVRQYGTPVAAIQWTDDAFSQYHSWLATQGTTPPTFKDPAGASWTNAIKPLVMIGQADVPGATNQTYADITNFVYYLKHDPTCVTPGGYQGCCFFRPGLQDTNNLLPGIAALSIGEPTITNQPTSLTNIAGTSATFSVAATNSGALGYQWYENGSVLANSTNISCAVSNTLTLASVQAGDAGDYRVVVSNFCGSVTSQVATLTVVLPPSITAQPQNVNVVAGSNASFSVTASGNTPLAYQWLFNGASLPAATDATLNLTNVQPTDAGSYSVIVTNGYGSVTSVVAHLRVAAAAVSVQPPGGLVLVGGNRHTLSLRTPLLTGPKGAVYCLCEQGVYTRIGPGHRRGSHFGAAAGARRGPKLHDPRGRRPAARTAQ